MELNDATNDTISRSALKETIIEPLNVNDAGKNDWYEGYYTAKNEDVYYIDNAQSVPLPDFKAGYKQAILDGIINFSKQKGAWIPINPDCRGYPEYFKCSICGAHIYTSGAEKELDYNGCPYCFADMRGEEE